MVELYLSLEIANEVMYLKRSLFHYVCKHLTHIVPKCTFIIRDNQKWYQI